MNKRGISPLIATVLLIGFVIVLGALLWIFLSGQVIQFQEKEAAKCSVTDAANTKISVSSCTPDVDIITLMVSNQGQGTIDGFRIRMFAGDTGVSVMQADTFEPGDSREFGVRTDELGSLPDKAEVFPFIIKEGGSVAVCDDNKIEVSCDK